eukprot:6203689-Pleurochrysis_carterae.AAC.1
MCAKTTTSSAHRALKSLSALTAEGRSLSFLNRLLWLCFAHFKTIVATNANTFPTSQLLLHEVLRFPA